MRSGRHTGLSNIPALHDRRLVAGRSARDLLPDLGAGRPGLPVQPQPAASRGRAARSAACAAARPCWPASAPTPSACGSSLFVTGRAARRARRLALCAHEPLRQPVAVRRARQHRVPADGGGRRPRPAGRRAGRLGAGAAAEERPAGRAADAHAARRPARGGGLRDALHPAAALRARRPDGLRAALDARSLRGAARRASRRRRWSRCRTARCRTAARRSCR